MDNRKKLIVALVVVSTIIGSIIVVRFPAPLGSIIVPNDYSSIQTAVDHAIAGQTIYVKSGVYTEQYITVNKPISIVGENPNNTILVGVNNVKYSPPYVIQISDDNVRISGFTITNGSLGGIRIETIGSDKQPTGCVITGNNLLNNVIGVSSYGGKDLTISNNQISNNTYYGISVSTSNSNIFENSITENGLFGILIDSCNEVSVKNNIISSNGYHTNIQDEKGGVSLRWFGNYNVYANNITNNNGDGVQFSEGCSNTIVHDNNVLGNGIGVKLFNFAITNNSENIGIGLNNQVYRNNLHNHLNALVQTTFAYGNLSNIYYAIGNGTDIVSWDNGVVGNYWSDYYGNGTYAIDQNNIDHHPLTEQVGISVKAPTLTPLSTGFSITVPFLVLVVAIIMGIVSLLLFRRHRKTVKPRCSKS